MTLAAFLIPAAAFVAGLLVGCGLTHLWLGSQRRLGRMLLAEAEASRQGETEALLDGVKLAFGDISLDTFQKLADQLRAQSQVIHSSERRLQGEQLQAERADYARRLDAVLRQFDKMQTLVRDLERSRAAGMGQLGAELARAGERAGELVSVTRSLAAVLGTAPARGQWGERLAEDILKASGLREGVSYHRQRQTQGSGSRPDFSFPMPGERVLHMDVKFPFDNWQRSVEAADEAARKRFQAQFLRDVRARIAELAARDYVAPASGTFDIVLMFVPNEQVFAAILAIEPRLVDEALARGVALVGPSTLFAVLAILRRSAESLRLAETTEALRRALIGLEEAWRAHAVDHDRMQRKLDDLFDAWSALKRARGDRVMRALAAVREASGVEPDPQPHQAPAEAQEALTDGTQGRDGGSG